MPVLHKLIAISALALLLPFSMVSSADSLAIPGHIPGESQLIMPKRGISMDRVLEEFGEPDRRIEPIGEPPITEWDYGDFRVYFEYQIVLHSLNLTTLISPK